MPIVIVSHIPILTVGTVGFTPELRKYPAGDADAYASRRSGTADAVTTVPECEIVPERPYASDEAPVSFGGIDFVNSGAVCGLWWKGDFHTDEGYNVVDLFEDGTYRTEYVSYGWEARGG